MRKVSLSFVALSLLITQCVQAQIWHSVGSGTGPIWCSAEMNGELFLGTNAGVYASSDGGITFSARSVGMPSGRVISLIVDEGVLLATIEYRGIYRSEDGGVTWTLSRAGEYFYNSGIGANGFRKFGDYVMAVNFDLVDSLFFSNDQGLTWLELDAPSFSNSSRYFPAGSYIYWFSFGVIDPVIGWYRSSDFGVTWSLVDDLPDTNRGEIMEVDGDIYYVADHIYRSEDDGDSWTQLTSSTYTPAWSSTEFSPRWVTYDGERFIGQNGGNALLAVASWKEGDASWVSMNDGVPTSGSATALFSFEGKTYLCRRDNKYKLNGNAWVPHQFPGISADRMTYVSAFGDKAYMVTETELGIVDDNSWTWQRSVIPGTAEFQGASSVAHHYGKLFVSAGSPFTGLDLKISENNGQTWTTSMTYFGSSIGEFVVISDTLHYLTSGGDIPYAIAIDSDGSFLNTYNPVSQGFSGGSVCHDMVKHNGRYFKLSGRIYPNGANLSYRDPGDYGWTNAQNVSNLGAYRAEALASFDGRLFMGMWANGEVIASGDNGISWESVSDGIEGTVVYDFQEAAGKLYAATDQGVFVLDENDMWTNISYNLPVKQVAHLASTPMYLFAHLQGGGAWRWAISDLANVGSAEEKTLRIYPNPASDIIHIDGGESFSGYRIYSSRGDLITTGRSNSRIESIDVGTLAPGIYQLISEDGKRVRFVVQSGKP